MKRLNPNLDIYQIFRRKNFHGRHMSKTIGATTWTSFISNLGPSIERFGVTRSTACVEIERKWLPSKRSRNLLKRKAEFLKREFATTGFSVLETFKLDHFQPVMVILSRYFSTLLPFIVHLGKTNFLLLQREDGRILEKGTHQ